MERINMDKKKLSKTREIELKQDLIVPDSKQDIFQIKETNFYHYLSKIEILNGKIKVNGNLDCYISYLSSSEETACLQTNFAFEDGFEDDMILETMNLQYNIQVLKQEVKVLNERKISIEATLKIEYQVFGTDSIEVFNDFDQSLELEVNSQKLNISSLVGVNTGLASLKEEIKLESTDIVSDILKVETTIMNKEVKISFNKVLAKADLAVGIKYLTQDGRVCEVEEKFPMMCFINVENVKEEDTCQNDYQVRNILLDFSNSEENAITVQMEYEIVCKAFENREQEVACDVYSLKYDMDIVSKEIEIEDEKAEGGIRTIQVVQEINKKGDLQDNGYSMVVYSVKRNETLWEISKRFKIKQENVIRSNNLEEPYNLRAGEKIYIVR
ncbi:MAG: DUF3794 domain-containing protein [Clostridia bacterium]|nr:DUF3794 domain-containing protein [Clostridia bacterium]